MNIGLPKNKECLIFFLNSMKKMLIRANMEGWSTVAMTICIISRNYYQEVFLSVFSPAEPDDTTSGLIRLPEPIDNTSYIPAGSITRKAIFGDILLDIRQAHHTNWWLNTQLSFPWPRHVTADAVSNSRRIETFLMGLF